MHRCRYLMPFLTRKLFQFIFHGYCICSAYRNTYNNNNESQYISMWCTSLINNVERLHFFLSFLILNSFFSCSPFTLMAQAVRQKHRVKKCVRPISWSRYGKQWRKVPATMMHVIASSHRSTLFFLLLLLLLLLLFNVDGAIKYLKHDRKQWLKPNDIDRFWFFCFIKKDVLDSVLSVFVVN